MTPSELTEELRERALGSILTAATGDALGAPYEFQPPISSSEDVDMIGGGMLNWEPGEWTDDTSMSVVILGVAADPKIGPDLTSTEALDQIAAGWYRWSLNTPDIGVLTSKVITRAVENASSDGRAVPSAHDFRCSAQSIYDTDGQGAGNGALMRTYAVVTTCLFAPKEHLTRSVLAVSSLTHVDPETDDAGVIWAHAIRHGILTGELNLHAGIDQIPEERRTLWLKRIDDAASAPSTFFNRNGWVVHALQAACSAIFAAGDVPEDKYEQRAYVSTVLDNAVRAGFDTDTVACIAGSLVGAVLGSRAVDPMWLRRVHGWPEYTARDLEELMDHILALQTTT